MNIDKKETSTIILKQKPNSKNENVNLLVHCYHHDLKYFVDQKKYINENLMAALNAVRDDVIL
jgi:hypothetical protein